MMMASGSLLYQLTILANSGSKAVSTQVLSTVSRNIAVITRIKDQSNGYMSSRNSNNG